jgi:hypothetical protein
MYIHLKTNYTSPFTQLAFFRPKKKLRSRRIPSESWRGLSRPRKIHSRFD